MRRPPKTRWSIGMRRGVDGGRSRPARRTPSAARRRDRSRTRTRVDPGGPPRSAGRTPWPASASARRRRRTRARRRRSRRPARPLGRDQVDLEVLRLEHRPDHSGDLAVAPCFDAAVTRTFMAWLLSERSGLVVDGIDREADVSTSRLQAQLRSGSTRRRASPRAAPRRSRARRRARGGRTRRGGQAMPRRPIVAAGIHRPAGPMPDGHEAATANAANRERDQRDREEPRPCRSRRRAASAARSRPS